MSAVLFALFAATAVHAQVTSTTSCGSLTCAAGYYCSTQYVYGLLTSAYTATPSYTCIQVKVPGSTCSTSSQCGSIFPASVSAYTTYVALYPSSYTLSTVYSAITTASSTTGYAIPVFYSTMCATNGRCCKSATCASGQCDSAGNCLGDTTSCTNGVSTSVVNTLGDLINTCYVNYFPAYSTTLSGVKSLTSTLTGSSVNIVTNDAILCSVGYYGTAGSCLPCPSGATTNYAGATVIGQCYCPAGTYLDVSNGLGASNFEFTKCTACPIGSNSSASPVTISYSGSASSASSSCSYAASTYSSQVAAFALQTTQYALSGNWSLTQNAFNTAFRESNNGQLGVQSSIFAFVVIIALLLVLANAVHFLAGLGKMLSSCKRTPKSPVTPAPSVTVKVEAPTA